MKIYLSFFIVFCTSMFSQSNFKIVSAQTEKIAERYFNNYMALDFDANADLMHDSISFTDPTAKLIFAGKYIEGKANVLANFKTAYASIQKMNFKVNKRIFSSYTAVFELDLHWEFTTEQTGKLIKIDMPLIVILTVKNGKVFEHRDYGDYHHFLKQYNEQSKSQ